MPHVSRHRVTQRFGWWLACASAVIAVLTGFCPFARATDVPYLTGRVVDNAEILKPATITSLTAQLKAHEDKTGDQVAILTTHSLQGESVEEFSNDVYRAWKLGQKGKDNGVLVVVSPDEHKMRIEVGYGLEGTLPDVTASRIIRNVMTPPFKDGDYDKGITDGANAIVAQLEGRGDAAGADALADASPASPTSFFDDGGSKLPWTERILMGCFIFGIIGLFTVVGVLTPGMGWFLYLFLIPFWAIFPIVVLGSRPTLFVLATYVIGFPIAKLIVRTRPWYAKAAADLKSKGSTHVGGWFISSGGSSGGGGGGSSDGGGFSGGGGDSGGGGASGSW
jgi:uncharacterized protein